MQLHTAASDTCFWYQSHKYEVIMTDIWDNLDNELIKAWNISPSIFPSITRLNDLLLPDLLTGSWGQGYCCNLSHLRLLKINKEANKVPGYSSFVDEYKKQIVNICNPVSTRSPMVLTHCGLLTPYDVGEPVHQLFWWWLGTCYVPNIYMNQRRRRIVIRTVRSTPR